MDVDVEEGEDVVGDRGRQEGTGEPRGEIRAGGRRKKKKACRRCVGREEKFDGGRPNSCSGFRAWTTHYLLPTDTV
jgi:hypothetical protein